jgi:hypothetical protein
VRLPHIPDDLRTTVLDHALRICPVAEQLDERPQ